MTKDMEFKFSQLISTRLFRLEWKLLAFRLIFFAIPIFGFTMSFSFSCVGFVILLIICASAFSRHQSFHFFAFPSIFSMPGVSDEIIMDHRSPWLMRVQFQLIEDISMDLRIS